MHRAVVDVAGVPVLLAATDGDRSEVVRSVLAGFAVTRARPRVSITVDADRAAVPSRAPRDEQFGIQLWQCPDGVVVAAGDVVGVVVGSDATIHLPDVGATGALDAVLPIALTWLLGLYGRFLIHGGAVARDGSALLALGHSGAGKSTLVGAALEQGWQVLSDDRVILSRDGDGVQVAGLLRAPAVPLEIGGPVVAAGTPLEGPRSRAILERGLLTPGSRRITGVVVVAHSDEAQGSLGTVAPYRVLTLLLQSFAGSIDPRLLTEFFALTELLGALPAWELGHAADTASRRMHVDRALDECWRRATTS